MCSRGYDVEEHIPQDLSGKVVVISGANSGIGFETARKLSSKGATIVFACRSEHRAKEAMNKIKAEQEDADLTFVELDLAKQSSIEAFVTKYTESFDKIDVLLNNAGVDKGPEGRGVWAPTDDGFEWVGGVNHFGTYALTIRLLNEGLFENSEDPRIVVATSQAHLPFMAGRFNIEDLDIKQRKYSFVLAYGQSKAMNVLFAHKLDRVFKEKGKPIKVILTHPGLVCTGINNDYAFVRVLGMKAEKGARVHIIASASEDIETGTYLGVASCGATYGPPAPISTAAYTRNEELQDALWELTEKRTNLTLNV